MSKIQEVTGMRIGQLIYKAITNHSGLGIFNDEGVGDKLFDISDEDLIKIVQDYIESLK